MRKTKDLGFVVSPGLPGVRSGRVAGGPYVVVIVEDRVAGPVQVFELAASYRPDYTPYDHRDENQGQRDQEVDDFHVSRVPS